MTGTEPRALCVPGKNSLTKIYFQSPQFLIITSTIFVALVNHLHMYSEMSLFLFNSSTTLKLAAGSLPRDRCGGEDGEGVCFFTCGFHVTPPMLGDRD